MKDPLKDTNAFDWQKQFEERAQSASDWLIAITKKVPLGQRRNIVKHIREGMEEASFHHDITYGATQIRDSIMFALWTYIPQIPNQTTLARGKIEDFAIWAAIQSPAYKQRIQDTFNKIIPEDDSEKEYRETVLANAYYNGQNY